MWVTGPTPAILPDHRPRRAMICFIWQESHVVRSASPENEARNRWIHRASQLHARKRQEKRKIGEITRDVRGAGVEIVVTDTPAMDDPEWEGDLVVCGFRWKVLEDVAER